MGTEPAMRIFSLAVLLLGWAYLVARHFSPAPATLVEADDFTRTFITIVFALWALLSGAVKFLVAMDVGKDKWFGTALASWLVFAIYILALFSGAQAVRAEFLWYEEILWLALFVFWPAFDIGVCIGAKRFSDREE